MIYAAIYTRISSSLQRTNYSLESQIDSCTRHAAANQLQVIQMFQDIASGTQLDRPGLNALRDTVRAGKLKAVLVHSADRLTRRAAHMVLLQQELADQGVTLYVVQSQSSTFSVDTLVMEAAFAEAEHDQMRERLQRGQQQRHSVGQAHGNKLPFGYCYSDASRTTIVIDENEAVIVRQIFDWFLVEPEGTFLIARRLSEQNIPTPADRHSYFARPKRRKAGEWSQSSVAKIVAQTAYKGELRVSVAGRPTTISVPAIVAQEQWERAASLRAARQDRFRKGPYKLYVLRSLVVCGRCGASCVGSHGGRKFHYYRCLGITKPKADRTKCNLPQFRDELLESAVWTWLCDSILRQTYLQQVLERSAGDDECLHRRAEQELQSVIAQLELLEQQKARLLILEAHGSLRRGDATVQLLHIERHIASCDIAMKEIETVLAGLQTTKQRVTRLCELLAVERPEDASRVLQHMVVNLLGLRITLDYKGEAGRGKRPALQAHIVCHLTGDSNTLALTISDS